MSPSSFIIHFVEDNVGHIVLNRPEYKNAITADMWRSIPDLIDLLSRNGARVIVFKGSGGSFAAGADLAELELLRTFEQAEDNWNAIISALNAVAESPIPTIAAIDGPCIGGGCLLAISCDLRYATSRSIFGVPVAKLGIVLDDVTIARLVALVGASRSREMLLRGNVIGGDQAQLIGLIHNIFSDESSLSSNVQLVIDDILGNSAKSVDACRRSISRVCGLNAFPSFDDPSAVIESYLTDEFRHRVSRALGHDRS